MGEAVPATDRAPPTHPDCVTDTLAERARGMPAGLIAVMAGEAGVRAVPDATRRDADGEYTVRAWRRGTAPARTRGGSPTTSAPSP